jgi:hypothetical protein
MEGPFEKLPEKTVAEFEKKKWKKKDLIEFLKKIRETFYEAISPFIDDYSKPIRVKLTLDNKGNNIVIPKFGVFTESMDVKPSNLKFTDYELRNHSKAGNTTGSNATNES